MKRFNDNGSGDDNYDDLMLITNIELGSHDVPTPLPATLPLFATGLGALGLLGWRRKRKQAA
jgi:PEP-CTERM motif